MKFEMIPGFLNNFTDNKIQEEILIRTKNMLDGANFVLSKESEEFEANFSKYFLKDFKSISTANATIALEIIFSFFQKNRKQKKMAIPTNTNFATVASALRAGWEVYLVDCNKNDLNLDINSFKELLDIIPDIDAVCLVHIAGIISKDIFEIIDLCNQNDVLIFEDCAHAVGCEFKENHAGSFSLASAFSFFPTKPLGATEGGMVCTKSQELIEYTISVRNQGKRKSKFGNLHEDFGGSWRINEFSSIMCNVFLPFFEKIYSQKLNEAYKINNLISNKIATNFPNHMNIWSVYKFLLIPENLKLKNHIINKLQDINVNPSGSVYERPIHLQPVFENKVKVVIPLKNSEKYCPLQIALPIPVSENKQYLNMLERIIREI